MKQVWVARLRRAHFVVYALPCIAFLPARVSAQYHPTVGAASAAAERDSTAMDKQMLLVSIHARHGVYVSSGTPPGSAASGPLITRPSWWPERKTHQNVAALLIAGTVGIGALWLLPEDVSGWDKSIPVGRNVKLSFTRPPVWDDDTYYWNYIVHPVTGSWVYLMERNHGRAPMRGFLLSTAASVGWEYGFETLMQRPSIQDLLITSTLGSLLGEVSHKATLALKKNGFNGVERVLLAVINPAYVVGKGYE